MEIRLSKKAAKFLKKQSLQNQQRIYIAIQALPAGDIKKLQNRNGWRLRVGDFRILFDRYGNIIDVLEIGNRGDIYK